MRKKYTMPFIVLLMFVVSLQTVPAGGAKEKDIEKERREQVEEELTRIEVSRQEMESREAKSAQELESGEPLLKEGDIIDLDVDSAVEVALARNLSIKSETITLRVKRRNKNTVFNYFYPTVGISGTLSRMHKEPGTVEQLVPVPAEDMAEYGYYDYIIPTNQLQGGLYGLSMDNPMGGLLGVESTSLDQYGMYDFVVPSNELPENMYGTVMKVEEEIPHTWNLSTKLSMNLMLSAQLVFGIKATILDYEAGRLSLETAKRKLDRNVRKQFYNLLLTEERIELMKQKIATAEDRYEQAKINYENGLVSEYNKLRAQVAFENMKPGLEDMRVGYRSMLLGFKQQLGLPIEAEIETDGSIEAVPLSLTAGPLIDAYLTNRLDIQSLVKQIEILRNSRDATIAGMTPAVSLMLSFDPTFMNDPFEDPWFEDVEEDWSGQSGMFGITVSVPLEKLLPFSKTWVELANTKDNIEKMQNNLAQAIQGAKVEVETTIMKLKKSLESIEAMEMNVQLAERAYDMAEEAYNAGNRELLEVKDAEDELRDARVKLLAEQYNYISGLLDLEYALNTSLTEIKETIQ